MTVGERIRDARKKKGLTQKQLGEMLNVTQATIQQYESGSPKLATLKRIATALDTSIAKLYGEAFNLNDLLSQTSIEYSEKMRRLILRLSKAGEYISGDLLLRLVQVLECATDDEIEQIVSFGEVLRANADNRPTGFSLIFSNDKPDESEGGNV